MASKRLKDRKRPRRASYVPPPAGARFCTVDEACGYAACGRNSLYNLLKEHPHVARKLHGKTVIDIAAFNAVLDKLPQLVRTGQGGRPRRMALAMIAAEATP
jgi:hypothetical protein